MLMQIPMRRVFRFVLLMGGVLVGSAGTIEACSCVTSEYPAQACELYGELDVAFVGRAIEVPPDRAAGRVRFQVRRAWKGVQGREVSALNDESGFGCGYQFESGREYLVFARRNRSGEIEIAPCSSTIWETGRSTSASAVAFAASLNRPATGGRIFGEVVASLSWEPPKRPVDGATVFLRGDGTERRTTSVDGRYEFPGLPPGTYSVSISMPIGYRAARSGRFREIRSSDQRVYAPSVTIADSRSCGYVPFEAAFDDRELARQSLPRAASRGPLWER
jgi:hypothetical protein